MDKAPDAFVVIDPDGIIKWANRAFLDLVEIGSKRSVIGEALARWLWRPGADLAVLLAHLQGNQVVRLFSTTVHSELGTDAEVEISAAGNIDTDPRLIGVLLRDVSRRLLVNNGSDNLRESLRLHLGTGRKDPAAQARAQYGRGGRAALREGSAVVGEWEPHGSCGDSRSQPSKPLC